ncbi:MAG: FAD-binding protein [Planctomycetaceae bacterium]|jgi:FAD/FMN-containing dehydrogenase/Fe-S oxidoreductase|nr:FAD-binding protein [Planctomycetaceae bacterium]
MLYLTPTQERLRDDIRGLIKGEIRCDEVTLQLYSTDGGLLQCKPQGVVFPRDIDDVVACTKYAAERGIPLHARGAGTGKCGGAIGEGIVLDFSRFMRKIVSLEHNYVVVQPGIVRYRLNELLTKIQGRIFGPVSGFEPTATIGGILARNGAGVNWLKYGFPSEHLCGLKIVTANGNVLNLDCNKLPEAIDSDPIMNNSFEATATKFETNENNLARGIAFARSLVLGKEHTLADKIYNVLNSSFDEIRLMNMLPPINSAGYALNHILKGAYGNHIDIARLICGSEGTLGLIVEAKLKTVPIPVRRACAVLFFDSFEKVAHTVDMIQDFNPILCELFDRRQLNLAVEWKPLFRNILPTDSEAALLIELNTNSENNTNSEKPDTSIDNDAEINELIKNMLDKIVVKESLCEKILRIETPEQFVLFDEFRRHGSLVLFQMRQSYQPLSIFDDVAIPLTAIHEFIPAVLNLLKRHEITASLSGHVGQGHLRITPILDLKRSDFVQQLRTLANDIYMLIISVGGSISSDCGEGYLKSVFLPHQYPSLMPVFRKIKKIFDPKNIFNPGKIIPDNEIWTQRIRRGINLRGSDHPEKFDTSAFKIEDNLSGLFLLDVQKRQAELESKLLSEERKQTDFKSDSNNNDVSVNTENDDNVKTKVSTINVTKINDGTARNQLELQLKWEPERFFEPTYLCNGCGDCLRLDRLVRMCPIFRRHPDEDAAPRSKANLLRGILEGELGLHVFTSERVNEIAEFCLHCKMCAVECPASVDVSQLAFNCKGFHVAASGLSLEDIFFSRIDVVLRLASFVSCPVNWAISNRVMRWLIEKILQIPRGRNLPTLAKLSFLTRLKWVKRLTNVVPRNVSENEKDIKISFKNNNQNNNENDIDNDNDIESKLKLSLSSGKGVNEFGEDSYDKTISDKIKKNAGKKVAVFVDTYLNYFDTKLVELAVRILEHNGFEVHIPPRQWSSGLSAFTVGDREHAERLARHNVLLLSDLIRQSYQVIAIEPATASCITREYKYVADDIDVAFVASNVVDFCDFLYRTYKSDNLRMDFRAINLKVGYHAPCRAIVNTVGRVNVPTPAEKILKLIPGLDVRRIERGCCGMAGMFGLKIRNYHRSMQIGLPLVKEMKNIDIDVGATDCMTCKLQIEQSVNKKILHPITLIAAAYQIISDKDYLKNRY